ncbi:hypothetical protein [Paraburkholderia sp. EG304]|uniref:hypothetical protein n=1 Tax=Paraburkholderia sp. EG304 TaxID=3237015 RepID=UPI00397C7A81
MEHLVRVQNERDRHTLAWLRAHVGDAAIAAAVQRCRGSAKPYLSTLRVTAPRFIEPRAQVASVMAEQSLATIRHILASRSSPRSPESMAVAAPMRRP